MIWQISCLLWNCMADGHEAWHVQDFSHEQLNIEFVKKKMCSEYSFRLSGQSENLMKQHRALYILGDHLVLQWNITYMGFTKQLDRQGTKTTMICFLQGPDTRLATSTKQYCSSFVPLLPQIQNCTDANMRQQFWQQWPINSIGAVSQKRGLWCLGGMQKSNWNCGKPIEGQGHQ